MFGDDITSYAFMALVAVAVGGGIFAVALPLLNRSASAGRVASIANPKDAAASRLNKMSEDTKEGRRKQIQETLNQLNEKEKSRKRLTLRARLDQAGLEISTRTFYIASVGAGIVLMVACLLFGLPFYAVGLVGFAGALGLPRWVVNYMRKRRTNKFLNDFADAIDVLVRGLKSGLAVNEAMRIISTEQGPPVGPEFLEVVEGQRVGIPIDQGLERMVERVPLAEVNFLAIVMAIQSKTGGNLAEALSNLSKVLRDRKKLKQKVQSVSQEAKSGAAIIGSLPFIIVGGMTFLNPTYMAPLFTTSMGNLLLGGCCVWMGIGVFIMRQMINFEV